MQTLYLCRHAETEWSLSGQHTGKQDLELTAKGKEEAEKLQKRLKKISFDHVFSSPKKRAKQTASPMKFTEDPLLVEWDYGDYGGKTRKEIQKTKPNWDLFLDGALNGETLEGIAKRAQDFLKKIQSFEGNLLIFSHGHFLRVFAAIYLQMKPIFGRSLDLSTASLSILKKEKDLSTLFLWNDVHHLEG